MHACMHSCLVHEHLAEMVCEHSIRKIADPGRVVYRYYSTPSPPFSQYPLLITHMKQNISTKGTETFETGSGTHLGHFWTIDKPAPSLR